MELVMSQISIPTNTTDCPCQNHSCFCLQEHLLSGTILVSKFCNMPPIISVILCKKKKIHQTVVVQLFLLTTTFEESNYSLECVASFLKHVRNKTGQESLVIICSVSHFNYITVWRFSSGNFFDDCLCSFALLFLPVMWILICHTLSH